MRGSIVLALTLAAAVAHADHTADDARRTSARLDRILAHADEASRPKPKLKAAPKTASATTKATSAPAKTAAKPSAAPAKSARAATRTVARHDDDDGDPLGDLIAHSLRIAFDPHEQAIHLRDLPKTPAEVDAHLRRLDRALDAAHHAR